MPYSNQAYYKTLSDDDLQKRLRRNIELYNAYANMVSKPGGWIVWDGDKQDQAERNVSDIKHEISSRKKKAYENTSK